MFTRWVEFFPTEKNGSLLSVYIILAVNYLSQKNAKKSIFNMPLCPS